MAHFDEEPRRMTKVTMLPAEGRSEGGRRRLHLRDITHEEPLEAHSVGAELRAVRLRRSEEIRSIAHILHIRRDYLEALEESRYEGLPGRAYALGFVRSYAEYLGLDSQHVVERYKSELDGDAMEEATEPASRFVPKAAGERRMPRGMGLVVVLIVAAGLYGVWLMSNSADQMVAQRQGAIPAEETDPSIQAAEANNSAAAHHPLESMPRGDTASAATPREGAISSMRLGVGVPGAKLAPGSEAAMMDASETVDQPLAARPAVEPLPAIPQGTVYGVENAGSRVSLRARKDDTWVRVEDADGRVLIEQTFKRGDLYRVPADRGAVLVARDASAIEIVVDGHSLGLAGPPTLVLTGKPLVADTLLAAAPKTEIEAAAADEEAAPVQ
ncbi:cytoskeleton protein RodZ [Parvibaculum sp. MBR-TMA-1.3b-4.2]